MWVLRHWGHWTATVFLLLTWDRNGSAVIRPAPVWFQYSFNVWRDCLSKHTRVTGINTSMFPVTCLTRADGCRPGAWGNNDISTTVTIKADDSSDLMIWEIYQLRTCLIRNCCSRTSYFSRNSRKVKWQRSHYIYIFTSTGQRFTFFNPD